MKTKIDSSMFGTESIGKILLHTAPPVMLAQLIQALYNIVDSYFVGKFSANGLTALSVIFPVQLVITALAIGIGVGVNTLMARQYAQTESEAADKTAGTGLVLTVTCWALFTLLAMALLRPYASMSAQSPEAVEFAVLYGRICCMGSLGKTGCLILGSHLCLRTCHLHICRSELWSQKDRTYFQKHTSLYCYVLRCMWRITGLYLYFL